MRIIFVRHGHPDYRKDCLTPLGHRHAALAANRLAEETIQRIFSSTCGRAYETAEYIARVQGIETADIVKCDFMREIQWGSDTETLYQNGHPWLTVDQMVANGESLLCEDWDTREYFAGNKCVESVKKIGIAFDELLADLGYVREGDFYRVKAPRYETVAVVSHGGASSAILACLFNLPFPFVCRSVCADYTAITIVSLEGDEGTLISPKFELINDAKHIASVKAKQYFGN